MMSSSLLAQDQNAKNKYLHFEQNKNVPKGHFRTEEISDDTLDVLHDYYLNRQKWKLTINYISIYDSKLGETHKITQFIFTFLNADISILPIYILIYNLPPPIYLHFNAIQCHFNIDSMHTIQAIAYAFMYRLIIN